MHKLIIEDDEGKTVVVPLIRDEITVGRQEGNTIRLTEQNISRRHARLVREKGVLFVEDLQSHNGIRVNGTRIGGRLALNNGDEVAIGDYKLGIQIENQDKTLGYDAAIPFARPPAAEVVAAPAAPPPAVAEIDGTPTIPVRTLADQAAADSEQVPPARLVVVSNLLSGHEFLLDRPSLVIGRTPENDVILNHKSISRHHAKIIRDGHRYIIVDLESANGVRVNGQAEERIELDSGDTVELGHVRLRFLEAGDTNLGGVSLRGGSKGKWLVMGGVAAAVAVAAVLVMGGGEPTPATKPVAATETPPTASPASAARTPAGTGQPTTAAPTKTASDYLNEAAALLEKQDWEGALTAARQAAQADPASSRVQELVRQIETDRTGFDRLSQLKTEAAAGNLDGAKLAADGIPAGSRFRRDVPELLAQARQNHIAAHLQNAQELAAAGDCTQAESEAKLVLAIDAKNANANNVISVCKKARKPATVAAAPRESKPTPPPSKPERSERPARSEPVVAATAPPATRAASNDDDEGGGGEPAGDADAHIKDAQDAWLKGQYAAAIEASRKALRARPGMMRAYQIIAVCSCSLRDKTAATRAYQRLDDRNRQLVKTLCQKNAITFE